MKGFTWVKQIGWHYVYNNKQRVLVLKSMANGTSKIVFNVAEGEVYEFVNYTKLGLNKYRKVKMTDKFNCNDTYWNADTGGYSMVHKGQFVENMSSEYKGDDLIVTAGDLGKRFRLKNYKSNLDDKVRKADRY